MANEAENTETKQVEVVDLNDILGMPGGDNVILPEDLNKPSIFSTKEVPDLKFIDKKDDKKKEEVKETPDEGVKGTTLEKREEEKKIENKPTAAAEVAEIIKEIAPEEKTELEKEEDKIGRPKINKEGMVELAKKLIENKTLVPFDDDKALDDYTVKDFEELFEANFKDRDDKVRQEVPVEFFDSLPEELQVAAKYHADGGTDMKGLFQILGQVEETRSLDAEVPEDQETIVREYLRATNFGTPEDIQEEIVSWKDLGKLSEKAGKFKPKLDKMHEQRVSQKLAQQENLKKKQQEASQVYLDSVYETLKPSELNGLKLDKKTQGLLYSGLTQPNYPSISGRPTNLLGHLLEKYQYVEPNHSLIAEALWLLSDPAGYRSKVKEGATNEQVEKTVRQLKTEESKKISSSTIIEKDETKQRKIPRNDNFFKR